MIEYLDWTGCYKRSWGKELVPAAYQHPAKISFSLTKRIYDFLFENDLLHAGGAETVDETLLAQLQAEIESGLYQIISEPLEGEK